MGGWLPTGQQEVLLRAALLPSVQAEADWLAWSQEVDLENDFIDQGSFRLLPMVYRNLGQHNPSLPKMGKLAGIYRRSWYRNQLISRSCSTLLKQLKEAGIESLLLKGVPLSQIYYQDMGARPMADADILISGDQLDDAINVLQEKGWTARGYDGVAYKQFLEFNHALGFINQQRVEVDIHARVFPTIFSDALVDDIWQQAVPMVYHGIQVKTLTPEYHLMHACAHGFSWNTVPPIRWVADSMMILSRSSVDWNLLMESAIAHDLHVDIVGHLQYLKTTWKQPVPDDIMERLQQEPSSRAKTRLLQNISRPLNSPLSGISRRWAFHRYYCHSIGRENLLFRILHFPKYMMMIWGQSSYRKFLVWGFNKLTLRTGQYFKRSLNKSGTT